MYLTQNITGTVGVFNNPQVGYTVSTQTEIDVYLLTEARINKVFEMKTSLKVWRNAGFIYKGSLPTVATFNLSENSARYADVKSSRRLGGLNKSKFFDISHMQRDFVDDAGFDAFTDAINEEEERIMEKDNGYEEQIAETTPASAVDAITISFAP